MDAQWFALWDNVAKHIPGRDRRSIIRRLLKRGADSPRAKAIYISQAEADELKRRIGWTVKVLGNMPLKVR